MFMVMKGAVKFIKSSNTDRLSYDLVIDSSNALVLAQGGAKYTNYFQIAFFDNSITHWTKSYHTVT